MLTYKEGIFIVAVILFTAVVQLTEGKDLSGKLIAWIKTRYNRTRIAVKRTKERIYRNRPLIKGFNIKRFGMELNVHPRHNRPKLYIQRYGKRD